MVLAYSSWSSSLTLAPFISPRRERRRSFAHTRRTRLAKRIVSAADSPEPPGGLCVIQLADGSTQLLPVQCAGADLARDFSKFVNDTGAVTPLKTRR